MNHIELFAGCGGLSLGLEQAGFDLVLANELSAMAAETFAYNLLGENLDEISRTSKEYSKTIWISSRHKELSKRLRENPFLYPDIGAGETDLPKNFGELKGKLVVGNIVHLNQLLEKNKKLKSVLKSGFGDGCIDLISGGPPCQSFSLAGLRQKDSDKNRLPWEFANFVDHIQPKIAVLENVSGILRAFKEDDVSYHAWYEIAKAFAGKGYYPLCLHINARQAGVPQNRPRFIMINIRKDIYKSLSKTFNEEEALLFAPSVSLYEAIRSGGTFDIQNYQYFDSMKSDQSQLFEKSFLSDLIRHAQVTVKEAIDDLRMTAPSMPTEFVTNLNERFLGVLGASKGCEIANHEPRSNCERVQRRFRIYQIMEECSNGTSKQVAAILKGSSDELSSEAWSELKEKQYLSNSGKRITFKNKSVLISYLEMHTTKKQTQKALDSSRPAPAALSIPDDACHYDEQELRTLTVREMARIQSFPDSFVFRSKITTGGQMRKFEVPQYTQVGNAVPPILGYNLGLCIMKLLNRL